MTDFRTFVFTPAGSADPTLAIAATRAGGLGVLNAELCSDTAAICAALLRLAAQARGPFGLKLDPALDAADTRLTHTVAGLLERGLRWLILDAEQLDGARHLVTRARRAGARVLLEVRSASWNESDLAPWADGLLIKGNESGGWVGEESAYILLQKWRRLTELPLYLRGGLTPAVAAACAAIGIEGGVLDSQLLLMDECRLPRTLASMLGSLAGSETVAVGNGESGDYFRLLVRPGLDEARQFAAAGEGLEAAQLREQVTGKARWQQPSRALLPIGQDVAFAAPWRKQYRTLAGVLQAIDRTVATQPDRAKRAAAITAHAPLAEALGVRFPIIQGPMTRVSDTAQFALAVADGGALPVIALAVLRGEALERLLKQTAELLGERPWAIGVLGFAPQDLLDEQLGAALRHAPKRAIIAGGRPDQAVQLEQAGIATYLHVPAANLIPTFLQQGARRFIFEGRECGGHIGPLSSFVLWSAVVDRLLRELDAHQIAASEIDVVFAGGIHDAVSSAMAQVIAAPLAAAGAKVGILMGSAYLFTQEIVTSGAVVEQFQREVIECHHTVNLESGVGHASRCAYTPFARDFFRRRAELKQSGLGAEERRHQLDELILGRLRIASKGTARDGLGGALRSVEPSQQHREGMYMLGQVATLRHHVTDIRSLHDEVTAGAASLLARLPHGLRDAHAEQVGTPADVAIVGIGCALPQAASADQYWQNILGKVNAITEIPAHRWDWRLYFDADREAKDKIYSKWGGFLEDMPFDPMKFGMPPKSIESVDTMQLMGLEVAHRTLADSGYADKPFDRERASVIIGASGGIGDVGMQYGIRAELPRFTGELPAALADQLPKWTEDSFAGILQNVAAGRIANRLDFGGINLTTDAACASSLAAIYQAVSELVAGRSDFVIAGGLDTVQGPFGFMCFSKTQALSARGRCATFDTDGDGIAISEGIAMVALKRLADAERDGDRIYAVIKGVGASSDGRAKGLTAPLPAGQVRAMRRAYEMAGFGPATVGLFEAHGTGTVVGDSTELESTSRLLQEDGATAHQSVIGSVKTILGHTKASAGVAGLVKTALALHHHVLPPHGFLSKPIEGLRRDDAPVHLLDEPMPWLAPTDHPRRAASSAFGFGGTNFHVVLEEYTGEYRPWMLPPGAQRWSAELLLCSGERTALIERLQSLQTAIADTDAFELRDLAASLYARYVHGSETVAVVARSAADLRTKLAAAIAYLKGEAKTLPPGIYHGAPATAPGRLAVLFSGQGSQYPYMLRDVAMQFATVSDTLAAADAALRAPFTARFGAGRSLSSFIFPRATYDDQGKEASKRQLASTDVAQPALGAVEVALFRLLGEFGLKPDMFAGHSYGEFVALFAAGAMDFDALMQISAARGRFIVDAAAAAGSDLGTMAAVNAPREVVLEALGAGGEVRLANHNAPSQSVISGTRAGVQAAAAQLRARQVDVTELPVAAAFHSPLVQPAQRELADLIDRTPWHAVTTPVYSNTTARLHEPDPGVVKRQMADHLIEPVEFVREIETMFDDGARVFLEIGPKPVLARLVDKILGQRPHQAIALDDGTGLPGFLAALGQLLCAGVPLDLKGLFAQRDCRVGDPQQPAALRPAEVVAKHAWMLNGSGARRASDPVRQIGITIEQRDAALAHRAAQERPQAGTPADQTFAATSVDPTRPYSLPNPPTRFRTAPISRRKDRAMDQRHTPSGPADSAVMSDYFDTMRQFLETQERVMAAFLGENLAARPAARPRSLPAPASRMAELAAAPAVIPTAPARVAVAPAPLAAAPPPPPPVAKPPAPAVAPAPVAVAAPAPAPAPKAVEAPAPTKANGEALTREKLQGLLLGIVEETTGYPRDMLGLDQNLEADLGIDSIKRVEIVGALLKALPQSYRDALTENRKKLNTQSTLNGMMSLVSQAAGGAAGPFDVAGMGAAAESISHPSRLTLHPQAEALSGEMARSLEPGLFVITCDTLGVAERLAERLRARGAAVQLIEAPVLAEESQLVASAAQVIAALHGGPLAGIVHLAALGAPALDPDGTPAQWRDALQHYEKSFYELIRELHGHLPARAHVVSASQFGGLFGRAGSASTALYLQGGAPGTLKSLAEERPGLRVKAIDLDPRCPVEQQADQLLAEIELDGGRQEVGYPAGQRTIFITLEDTLTLPPQAEAGLRPLVVLATGGARGVTAEVLREVALPGNHLVLTGRSQIPESEAPDTAAIGEPEALRAHFVAKVRSGELKLTPSEIQRRVRSLIDMREMRANLADFRAGGAAVEYHAVDVTDEQALRAVIEDVTRRLGRIDGIVHGAGVIEDKLLADKRSDSWSRVVDTKVIGLLLLQKLVDAATLKFFITFSSVAGRYGNSGQSDYATANELMNRLCAGLQSRWGSRVAVRALCWGPWGPTKFGAGMVTKETEAKFEQRGVFLVSAALGRSLFRGEILRAGGEPVEIICGAGPWEAEEQRRGAIRLGPSAPAPAPTVADVAVPAPASVPLSLGGTNTSPTGVKTVEAQIGPGAHPSLPSPLIDGRSVLPAGAALELMAECARTVWPGWRVIEVRELRPTHRLVANGGRFDVKVILNPPPYGSPQGFEVSAAVIAGGNGSAPQACYECVVRLEQSLPAPVVMERNEHHDRAVPMARVYGDMLHRPEPLQVLQAIEGVSASGLAARAHGTPDASRWLFDPALVDAAGQLLALWARSWSEQVAVPSRYGRIVRFSEQCPSTVRAEFRHLESTEPGVIRGDVVFLDEHDHAVMLVEDLVALARPLTARRDSTTIIEAGALA